MSFSQIFKSSFLEGFTSADITLRTITVTLGITVLFGLYLFFVYQIFTRKTFYSKSFNMAIPLISLITAAIIMTIQSSLVVSLGMVGALSIVRFRTAIKDPMDLIFLYWAISIGIITGAGLAGIAFVATAFVTLLLIFLEYLPVSKAPKLLIINAAAFDQENQILDTVKQLTSSCTVKSRTVESGEEQGAVERLDMILEIRTKDEAALVAAVAGLPSVNCCSLMDHDGEVTF